MREMKKKTNHFYCCHKILPSEKYCQFGLDGKTQNCDDCNHNNDCRFCAKIKDKALCEKCINDRKTDSTQG